MFCENCGKKLEENEKFCSGCGFAVKHVSVQPAENSETVEKPGAGGPDFSVRNDSADSAAPLRQQETAGSELPEKQGEADTPEKKKSRKPAAVIIAVLLITVGIIIACNVRKKPAENGDKTSAVTGVTEETEPVKENDDRSLPTETAVIYKKVLEDIEAYNGEARITENGRYLEGAYYAKLEKLDSDDVYDLIVAYCRRDTDPDEKEYLYETPYWNVYLSSANKAGEPSPLFYADRYYSAGENVSNLGNDAAPAVVLAYKGGRTYIVSEDSMHKEFSYVNEDGTLFTEFSYLEDELGEEYINGKKTAKEDAAASLKEFESSIKYDEKLLYSDNKADLEKIIKEYGGVRDRIDCAASGVGYFLKYYPDYKPETGEKTAELGIDPEEIMPGEKTFTKYIAIARADAAGKEEIINVVSVPEVNGEMTLNIGLRTVENKKDKWLVQVSGFWYSSVVIVDGKKGKIETVAGGESALETEVYGDLIMCYHYRTSMDPVPFFIADWNGKKLFSSDNVMNGYTDGDRFYYVYLTSENEKVDSYVYRISLDDVRKGKKITPAELYRTDRYTYLTENGIVECYGEETLRIPPDVYDPDNYKCPYKTLKSLEGNRYVYKYPSVSSQWAPDADETAAEYSVKILGSDDKNKTLKIEIDYTAENASYVCSAETTAGMNGSLGTFKYEDSWGSSGQGRILFNADKTVTVLVSETDTTEAARGTLDTNEELVLSPGK